MSGLLWGILSAVTVLAVLLLTLLMTPVKLDMTVRTSPNWRLKIAACLLGGLTPPIPIHDSDRQRPKKKKPPPPPGRQKTRASRYRPGLPRIRRMISAAPHLLAGLLRSIHLQYLNADVDIGFPDPADTGQVVGLLAPAIYSRRPTDAVHIAVRPDFSTARFSGEIVAVLTFIPAALMPPAIRFAWRVFGPRS